MTETFFLSIVVTGFVVAFAHAAIPTHWLPFVLAGRGQRWGKAKTLVVVAHCGSGHVLFTTILGVLVVWLGIETSKWTGNLFPWIAGSALILFGLYYLVRQVRGGGHGHSHFGGGQATAITVTALKIMMTTAMVAMTTPPRPSGSILATARCCWRSSRTASRPGSECGPKGHRLYRAQRR